MSAAARERSGPSGAGTWAGRRVFVTGAAGFIGSWLTQELKRRGAFTIGLMRDRGGQVAGRQDPRCAPDAIVYGVLEDYETVLRAINEYEADTIFHLGGQPIVSTALLHPRSTFEANIRGTWHVLEACREPAGSVRRLIIPSTDKVYGEAQLLPYREEETPLEARHPYDVSKGCADMLAQCYHHCYGVPVCIARLGNVFGGCDLNFSRLVPGTICALLKAERPVLRSDGTMIRDYLYVRDAVLAFLLLAERMSDPAIHGHVFQFSNEEPVSVLEMTRRILALGGRDDLEPVILGKATHEISQQYLSADKARAILDWRPRWTLDDGLAETIDWYRGWFDRQPRL